MEWVVLMVARRGSVCHGTEFPNGVGLNQKGQWTLSKSANDSKLCSVVNMMEGSDATQKDPDILEWWDHANLMNLVRCHLEYCIQLWVLHHKKKTCWSGNKDIQICEHLSCEDKLRELEFPG
ncbi:hypothetical protein TURU_138494 [Turdus rufiventris]|nr:hypothetical protein TURU_138494 [Turdus rufiventris]